MIGPKSVFLSLRFRSVECITGWGEPPHYDSETNGRYIHQFQKSPAIVLRCVDHLGPTKPWNSCLHTAIGFAQRRVKIAASIPAPSSNNKSPKQIHTTMEVRYLICGVCRITA